MGTRRRGTSAPTVTAGAEAGARKVRPRLAGVRKRDGRLVPFQRSKIEDAVAAALQAAGAPDPGFAREVAEVVELTLLAPRPGEKGGDEPRVPAIEEIQDLVERALMELGRPAAAKAYILDRDRRARIRSALRVHRSSALGVPVRVRETDGVSSWSKGRIVAALMEEAELAREAAEDVAAQVERRVFDSGLKRITTGLVRELVSGELFERGWTQALSSARAIGLSRHDLRRALRGERLTPWRRGATPDVRDGASLDRTLAGELLRRHALEDVLPEGAGELHRAGDLHVVDLDGLDRPRTLCLDAQLLSEGGHPGRGAWSALDGIAELARGVGRSLVLEHPEKLLAPLVRGTRRSSPHGIGAWLQAVGALGRAAGVRVELGSLGTRSTAFGARLVHELALLGAEPWAPRLYLEGHELEELLAADREARAPVELLLAQGRLATTWGEEDERFVGPGCHRRRDEPGLLGCAGAIALNLPRLARRAGPFGEELMLRGLAELVQAASELAAALLRFQRAQGPKGPGGMHVRSSFALLPVGLREALRTLGDGTIDASLGARLLGFFAEAARRFAPAGSASVVPSPFFGAEAARRFAWLDSRRAREEGGTQRWLFDEAEGDDGTTRAYSHGYLLSPAPDRTPGRLEAEVLRTLPAGALAFAGLAAVGGDAPHLDAWRRFEVLRRASVGEVELELFPLAAVASGARNAPRGALHPLRPLA